MTTPKDEVDQKRDEALRRMLNTPRKPHTSGTSKTARKKPATERKKAK